MTTGLLAVFGIWVVLIGIVEWARRRYPILESINGSEPPVSRVSIVLAARNEALVIRQTLLKLQLIGPVVSQIIVVNDRSTDATDTEIAGVPDPTGRLSQVRVDTLPQGWLGKQYALWQGARLASGDWIVFLDADSRLSPLAIEKALHYAQSVHLDYLSVIPNLSIQGPVARAFLGFFGFVMAMSLRLVLTNLRSRRWTGIGIGAFQMVRRDLYFAIGGHWGIRQCATDDVALANRFKRLGLATGLILAGPAVVVPWYQSLYDVIHGFEKNFYSLVHYRKSAVLGVIGLFFMLFLLPDVGLFLLRGPWWLLDMLTIIIVWGEYWRISQQALNMGVLAPSLFFLMPILFLFLMIRSACRTENQQGILWRDTFYPLSMLRGQCQEPIESVKGAKP